MYDRNIFESSSVGSSSAIFGKCSERSRPDYGTILKNFRKSSESGRKSAENRQKRRHQYVIKRTYTLHVRSKFKPLWQQQYLTCSLRLLVRYSSYPSNIKFISSRHRVIFSISFSSCIWLILLKYIVLSTCLILKHLKLNSPFTCNQLTYVLFSRVV